MAKGNTLEIVYRWLLNGREEVRYRREPADGEEARKLLQELEEMEARCRAMGEECPYFSRVV